MRRLFALFLALIIAIVSVGIGTSAEASEISSSSTTIENRGHASCAGITIDTPMTPECEGLIAARPTPNVSPVPVEFGVISGMTFIRFNRNEVAVYDAPNGTQIDTYVTGYTYVTPEVIDGRWARLSAGRWVSLNNTTSTTPPAVSGVMINGALDMPFAFILWDHDATVAPAGRSDRENGRYHRFQVVNIYATVHVNGWDWHLIGPNHWTNQRNLSIVYPHAPASFGGRWAGINLYEQNLVAYENNTPVMAGLVSSGLKNGRWDTPEGTFQVGVRLEADTMSGAEGASDYYSLDAVPYAQYFNGLISIHGTYWHSSFGYPHSHGCVNVSVSDSYWLFNFLSEGSTVHVYNGTPDA